MCKCLNYIEIISTICSLINKEGTGSPKELSNRLGISERTTFRIIESLIDMRMPIKYSRIKRSYICDRNSIIEYSFTIKVLTEDEEKLIIGGVRASQLDLDKLILNK